MTVPNARPPQRHMMTSMCQHRDDSSSARGGGGGGSGEVGAAVPSLSPHELAKFAASAKFRLLST